MELVGHPNPLNAKAAAQTGTAWVQMETHPYVHFAYLIYKENWGNVDLPRDVKRRASPMMSVKAL